MTHFFEHTPQSTDEVNQVENLATEVTEAFDKVEDVLFEDNSINASITSSIGDLDNKYIKEYVPNNGWINNYNQTLYFPSNSQSASLDLYPSMGVEDLNTVSIHNLTSPSTNYIYKHSGILETDTDFTFVDRKVILGFAPSSSDTLTITYKGFNTTTPEDNDSWPFELKYNVLQIKQYDNSLIKEFEVDSEENTYTVSGYDFKSLCSVHIQNIVDNKPQDLNKYVTIYADNVRLDTYNIEITNNFIRFNCDEDITSPIKIYVANASLSRLIECLYRLFYAHDHGSNGGQGVNHNSLLGLYENTDVIKYQVTNKSNYDHPQYFNREGYITDGTVYNNAILGDLLLASTSEGNRKNNLDANSVKLIFGEYNSGTRLYHNSSEDCLWLDSISKDGVKLVTPKDKKALSINDHSFVDTTYISSDSNKALKLTLKSDKEEELGIFKLTRKITKNNETIDDDKAKLISYASEFSLSTIKSQLTIDNGAKISFGSPSIIDLVLNESGLHFKGEEGQLTDISTVNFDIPVKANQMSIKHLDAEETHLTETQKIVFGLTNHEDTSSQYVNYKDDKLNIKTNNSVTFASNGRRTGISLDNRQFIYTATPQGFPILDSVEYTDLFFETKRATYFIDSDYNYVPGVTSLHTVPRSSIYCDSSFVNNVSITYDETLTNGLILSNNNKIFAQRDLSENISTILQSNTGVVVASSYNPVGPIINYGKITAKTFIAEGNKETEAGFYGNIIVPINNRLTINGTTEFNSDITFNKAVTFTDKVTAKTIDAENITTNTLYVKDKATYNNIEVLEELRFNTMLQTNRVANSEFEGTVQFNNNITMPDSNNFFVLGNKDIEDTRTSSGLYLSHKEVRLGTNGVVSSGKYFASKGTPSGNGDSTGGYSFASTNGTLDGDTGLFCEGHIEEQNNSDLVFRIDGVEKGRFLKETIDITALDLTGKEKAIVTLDMLLNQITSLSSDTLNRVYPIGSIYENSIDGRNPSVLLEWPSSVWKRYAVGRSIMGASGTGVGETVDDYLNLPAGLNTLAAGSKFGDYVHKIILGELPNHGHSKYPFNKFTSRASESGKSSINAEDYNIVDREYSVGQMDEKDWEDATEQKVGSDLPHNNTHPIIITHVWERIG